MIKATETNELFRKIGQPPRTWTLIRGNDVLEAHKLRMAKLTRSKVEKGAEYQMLTALGEKLWDCMFRVEAD